MRLLGRIFRLSVLGLLAKIEVAAAQAASCTVRAWLASWPRKAQRNTKTNAQQWLGVWTFDRSGRRIGMDPYGAIPGETKALATAGVGVTGFVRCGRPSPATR